MASPAELIEGIWVAHTELIEGIRTTLPYEPGEIDRKLLPMMTLFNLLSEGVETATGPTEDVSYLFEVSIYVSLTDWKRAQIQMRDLAQAVVTNFRQHRADYDLSQPYDMFARKLSRRVPPTPGEDNAYLRASYELHVTVGEM